MRRPAPQTSGEAKPSHRSKDHALSVFATSVGTALPKKFGTRRHARAAESKVAAKGCGNRKDGFASVFLACESNRSTNFEIGGFGGESLVRVAAR